MRHLILLVLFTTSAFSFATEIHYISAAEKAQLQSDFDSAKPVQQVSGSWVCDMFGVSSKLQVIRNVKLYSFEASKNSFQNHGAQAQIVPVYSLINGEMQGRGAKANDQIRRAKDGQLLSKLSHDGLTIAYSRCRPG